MIRVSLWFGLMAACLWSADADAGSPFAGKKVYEAHACGTCHGVDGQPLVATVPSFVKGERLHKPDYELMQTIMMGKGVMPAFRGQLTRQQMEDVVVYIRTFFR